MASNDKLWFMPWPFLALVTLYSLLSLLFAFVAPPNAVSSFFKVPSVFVFLPEKLVVPAGRIFVGLCGLFFVAYFAIKMRGVAY